MESIEKFCSSVGHARQRSGYRTNVRNAVQWLSEAFRSRRLPARSGSQGDAGSNEGFAHGLSVGTQVLTDLRQGPTLLIELLSFSQVTFDNSASSRGAAATDMGHNRRRMDLETLGQVDDRFASQVQLDEAIRLFKSQAVLNLAGGTSTLRWCSRGHVK
jgi:hypothetical protein